MYVCPKIYIRRALSKTSQSRRGLKQTETSSVHLLYFKASYVKLIEARPILSEQK